MIPTPNTSPVSIGPGSRLPDGSWKTLWIAASMFVVAVGWLEVAASSWGIQAREQDTPVRWAATYRTALADPSSVVIVGSSRSLYGLDPAVLEHSIARPVYHLGINGGNPRLVLTRLAEDQYEGTVIVSAMEFRFLSPDERGVRTSTDYLGALDSTSAVSGFESLLARLAAVHFRTRAQSLQLLEILKTTLGGELPQDAARWTRMDRFESVELDRVNGSALETRWAASLRDQAPFAGTERADAIQWASSIDESMAGQLYWVRLPSTGLVAEVEALQYPRESGFQSFVGGRNWHFEDDGLTRGLRCFDGSHLDPSDAPLLSEVVGEWVRTHTNSR